MKIAIDNTSSKPLETRIAAMQSAGPQSLYILSDFDRTLTKAYINGKNVPSLISILRDEGYLTADYPARAHALYEKYHPLEIDPDVSLEEKAESAREWWEAHFALLIASRLNKKDIERAVTSQNFKLRDGFQEFFSLAEKHSVPVIIMSASGLGQEGIRAHLLHNAIQYNNIRIISNSFEWDADGYAIAVKKPGINGMNKNGRTIMQSPIYSYIHGRNNIILLGDSESDLAMANNLPYQNLISICFMSDSDQPNTDALNTSFDIVIPNDGGMEKVVELLKKVTVP